MRPNFPAALAMAASLALSVSFFAALPAEAHDGIHVTEPYARSSGAVGGSGAVFFVVDNHQIEDDRLISAATNVAERVEIHTHREDASGVMQMVHLEEGLPIAAMTATALERGGNHVMLLGLTREMKDGDMITLTLTFARAGVVEVEVPVDNARKPGGHGAHSGHGAAGADAAVSE